MKLGPCNNPECAVSHGICGSLTFGSGELDDYGYWERPCSTCARSFERDHPEAGPCWPFQRKVRSEANT